jgi:hypothetical protein
MKGYLEGLGNKSFAFECLRLLEENNVPVEVVYRLTDVDYCRHNLDCREAILKISSETPMRKDIADNCGRPRFYSEVYNYRGHYFLVTNFWYGPKTQIKDNRTPFMDWVFMMIERS